MSYHIRKQLGEGYNEIVPADNPDLKFIQFGIVNLAAGQSYESKLDANELVGVVLSGRCAVSGDGFNWPGLGGRVNVFMGRATGFYVPVGRAFKIAADGPVSVALSRAPSDLECDPILVTPDDVKVKRVGRHNWEREVHDIISSAHKCRRLVVGETFNPPGHWSSAPPHRHENENPPVEAAMEEVYHFRVFPTRGFGMQRIYTDDRTIDEAYPIEDTDTVIIPRGYHPVAAAPGYRLYYLWILAGENRVLCPRDDPDHAWLKDCEPIVDALG